MQTGIDYAAVALDYALDKQATQAALVKMAALVHRQHADGGHWGDCPDTACDEARALVESVFG